MNSSWPEGRKKVTAPMAQFLAMRRSAARKTAGAPLSSGRLRNARRSLARSASEGPHEGLWARLMIASPERSLTTHITSGHAGENRPRSRGYVQSAMIDAGGVGFEA